MRKVDFFVIGAQKAGTSAIDSALRMHSHIYMSPIKEPNHFCFDIHEALARRQPEDAISLDLDKYLGCAEKKAVNMYFVFDFYNYEGLFSDAPDGMTLGECSTTYLPSLTSAVQIYEYNPKAKIIVCLRNPFERIRSHYEMNVRTGIERRSLSEALSSEMLGYPLPWSKSGSYIKQSLYSGSLSRYLNAFGRERVMVVLFDDLKNDPYGVMCKITNFIGVASFPEGFQIERINESMSPRFKGINFFLQRSGAKTFLRSYLPRGLKNIGKTFLFKPSKNMTGFKFTADLKDIIEIDRRGLLEIGVIAPEGWYLQD